MKRYTALLLMVVSLVFSSSCKKLLDKEPKNTMTDANFWKDEAEATSAVSAAYSLLRTAINYPEGVGHYAWGDLPTDEFSPSQTLNQGDYTNINQMNLQISVSSTAATND